MAGFGMLAIGGGLALSGAVVAANEERLTLGSGLLLGGGALLAVTAGLALGRASDAENLLEEYSTRDLTDESVRSRAVADAEQRLAEIAEDYRQTRLITGVGSLVAGAGAFTFLGIHAATTSDPYRLAPIDGVTIAAGSLLVLTGLYQLLLHRYPVERTVELYERELDLERSAGVLTPSLSVTPHGTTLGLGGAF